MMVHVINQTARNAQKTNFKSIQAPIREAITINRSGDHVGVRV